MSTALLVLEDGRVFKGQSYGAEGKTLGELVFATGMTGYQETLTDPSYAGQIVVQTAPHIGNTGVNSRDEESTKVWVAGYVVRDPSRIVSNFRAEKSLPDELKKFGIVSISGIDTRALTIHLRSAGSMRAGIFSGEAAEASVEELLVQVKSAAQMKGLSLSDQVTTDVAYTVAAEGTKVGKVAGCQVTEGTVQRGAKVRLIRDNVVIHEGTLSTLKRFKDEVKEVQSGQECGMAFENYDDIRPGDVIEIFEREEVERSL